MLQVNFNEIDQLSNLLQQLSNAGVNLTPAANAIGERLTETTKRRFATSKAPDGNPWKRNTITTLVRHTLRYRSSTTQAGRLSQAGTNRITGKKPLVGESRTLSTTINYRTRNNTVTLGSPTKYAAVQQFGAERGSLGQSAHGPTPWGDIPARPFLGVSQQDETDMIQILREHFQNSVE